MVFDMNDCIISTARRNIGMYEQALRGLTEDIDMQALTAVLRMHIPGETERRTLLERICSRALSNDDRSLVARLAEDERRRMAYAQEMQRRNRRSGVRY